MRLDLRAFRWLFRVPGTALEGGSAYLSAYWHVCALELWHKALGLSVCDSVTEGTKVLKGLNDFLLSLIALNMEVLDLMELFSCPPDVT